MLTVSRMSLEVKRVVLQGLPQSLRDMPGFARRTAAQGDCEFFAAKPRYDVVASQFRFKQLSQLLQDRIATVVPEFVVHFLEMVEIENQDGVL